MNLYLYRNRDDAGEYGILRALDTDHAADLLTPRFREFYNDSQRVELLRFEDQTEPGPLLERFAERVTVAVPREAMVDGEPLAVRMANEGFTLESTGGGCTAYQKTAATDGGYWCITNAEDASAPEAWLGDKVALGRYDANGDGLGTTLTFDHLAEAVAFVRGSEAKPS